VVLKRSPVMLPIPGTSKLAHLEENVAVINIELSDEEFDILDREGRTEYRQAWGMKFPLYPQKQTFSLSASMSAKCH
jgi:diketogulonate reductase-like aldo/keto reductase